MGDIDGERGKERNKNMNNCFNKRKSRREKISAHEMENSETSEKDCKREDAPRGRDHARDLKTKCWLIKREVGSALSPTVPHMTLD